MRSEVAPQLGVVEPSQAALADPRVLGLELGDRRKCRISRGCVRRASGVESFAGSSSTSSQPPAISMAWRVMPPSPRTTSGARGWFRRSGTSDRPSRPTLPSAGRARPASDTGRRAARRPGCASAARTSTRRTDEERHVHDVLSQDSVPEEDGRGADHLAVVRRDDHPRALEEARVAQGAEELRPALRRRSGCPRRRRARSRRRASARAAHPRAPRRERRRSG